jgi:hypothetical protein
LLTRAGGPRQLPRGSRGRCPGSCLLRHPARRRPRLERTNHSRPLALRLSPRGLAPACGPDIVLVIHRSCPLPAEAPTPNQRRPLPFALPQVIALCIVMACGGGVVSGLPISTLLAFKNCISNPGKLSSWNVSRHVCEWHGVVCEQADVLEISVWVPWSSRKGHRACGAALVCGGAAYAAWRRRSFAYRAHRPPCSRSGTSPGCMVPP